MHLARAQRGEASAARRAPHPDGAVEAARDDHPVEATATSSTIGRSLAPASLLQECHRGDGGTVAMEYHFTLEARARVTNRRLQQHTHM